MQRAPGDPRSLYVATTFGLLVSRDNGCSFRWVCEANIGVSGSFDPKYRVARDGTLFATTSTGLRISRDGGCSFTTALANTWIDAIDVGPTGEIWLATADGGKPNNVYRSTDNGATFAPRGMQSPAIWWKSVRVAPGRAVRVYATGYQVAGARPGGGQVAPTAHFVTSDDSGASWTASPLTGVAFGPTPLVYAVAVDPADPDVVMMVSAGAGPPGGDRLYRSTDGGATWREVLATPAAIVDVAITAHGVFVATRGAAFRSRDHGATFQALASPRLACVGEGVDGVLFGCGANWEPDHMAVARSRDGQTWEKALRFVELAGPLECPAGTAEHDACRAQWPALRDQLGATAPPACPVAAAPATRSRGGSCDASGASSGALLGLLLLLLGVTAPRASSGSAAARRARRAAGG